MEAASLEPEAREAVKKLSSLWWLWIVFGVGWTIIGVVILQFDQASINTVGILVGAMFLATGFQQLMIQDTVQGKTGALQVHRKGYVDNLEAAPLDLEGRSTLPWTIPGALALGRTLQQQWDPKQILNPWRIAL